MEQRPLLVSVPEAQRILGGLSRAKIHLMVRAGELTKRKIGTRAFLTYESVERIARGDETHDAKRGAA